MRRNGSTFTKPEYLSSSTLTNNSENEYFLKRQHSVATSLLVIIVSVGFMLTGLYMLWRRYHYSNSQVICHYTTLNQEFTLSADEMTAPVDDAMEFHLDLSDTQSSDDEVSSNYLLYIYII